MEIVAAAVAAWREGAPGRAVEGIATVNRARTPEGATFSLVMAVADGLERDQAWPAGNRMLLPRAAASALRQSVAAPDREPDRPLQARKTPPGARKICELLIRRLRGEVRCHVVLDRHGLVQRAAGTPAVDGRRAQGLGCAGYKGEFRLGDGRYCYPLTVTDQASRFVLLCEGRYCT